MSSARKCPSLGIFCYLGWCRENDACQTMNALGRRPKAFSCEKYGGECTQRVCVEGGRCVAMANAESKVVNLTKAYRKCPCAVPGSSDENCIDPQCVRLDKCMDQVYGAIPVNQSSSMFGASPAAAGLASEAVVCPHDNKNCMMATCDGGKSCYMKNNKVGYTTTYTQCHSGVYSLGFIKEAEICVCKKLHAEDWDETADGPRGLIIGLLGEPFPQGSVVGLNQAAQGLKSAKALVAVKPPIPNIWIKWPDYGIVDLDQTWWDGLIQTIKGVKGAVVIYCMGGHGRTGTAASIICSLGGLVPADEDPVAWVRAKYCDHAVESVSQLKYIEKITGRVVQAKEYKPVGNVTVYGSGVVVKKKTKVKGPKHEHDGRLSIKKWKTWWRGQKKDGQYAAIANVTRPKDLPQGQTFTIGKVTWKWDLAEHRFERVE